MLNFAGSPYIDLRVDLNSFLPSDLDDKISEKLLNFFIKKIKKKPEIHDKIEFELINTCFDFFDANAYMQQLVGVCSRYWRNKRITPIAGYGESVSKFSMKMDDQFAKRMKVASYCACV